MIATIINFLKANLIDIFALFISIFAAFFSIKTHNDNKALSEKGIDISIKELNRRFFDEIYFSFLTDTIPEKTKAFDSIDEKALNASLELENIFYNIMEKSYFYKYFDKSFYDNLKLIILDLQNLTFDITISLKIYLKGDSEESSKQADIYRNTKVEFFKRLEDLYLLFRNYYSGY